MIKANKSSAKAKKDANKSKDKTATKPSTVTDAGNKKASPSPADFTKLPARYSNTQAGMNWWSFHIRTMTTGQRYLYVGLIIFVPVFIGCMIGLCVDSLFHQEATFAYWGIVIGSLSAVVIAYTQLRQLVDAPDVKVEKPKNKPRAKLSKASTKKLSDEEKDLIAQAKAELNKVDDKSPSSSTETKSETDKDQ